jgi:hypothetical protein
MEKSAGNLDLDRTACHGGARCRLPRDNQDERPATIKMRMAPGAG